MAKEPLYPHIPKSKLGAFICGQCGKRFHSMEELNRHLARYHPEANSSVTRLAKTSAGTSFPLGRLVWTRGVNDMIAENTKFSLFVLTSLQRHAKGDWGDLSEEDKKENEYSLTRHLRLLSAYEQHGLPKIWIITESDRSVTTVLFPDEY
ncbi:hypothetical protein ES708_10201 [subsurface metagenome]